MFKKENLHLLGFITKTHGVHGACILKLEALKAENIPGIETVFMEIDGLLVPYFISQLTDRDQSSMIITFDDIDSKDKAEKLTGYEIYIHADKISLPDNIHSATQDITGYTVMDKKYGDIGRITSIVNIQNNTLLKVKSGDKEYLIPGHEDIIKDRDDYKKTLYTDLPEGLLDI